MNKYDNIVYSSLEISIASLKLLVLLLVLYLMYDLLAELKPPAKPVQYTMPAVEPPHPGASYNPSYEDHQVGHLAFCSLFK